MKWILKNKKWFLPCFIALLFLITVPVVYADEIIEGIEVTDEGEPVEPGLKPEESRKIAEEQGRTESPKSGGIINVVNGVELDFYTIAYAGSGTPPTYSIEYAACSEVLPPNTIYYLDLVSAGIHKQRLKLGYDPEPGLKSGSSISRKHIWSNTIAYRGARSKWSDVTYSRALRISSSHLYHLKNDEGPLAPIIFTQADCVHGAAGRQVKR
jgi:hypothetical protein